MERDSHPFCWILIRFQKWQIGHRTEEQSLSPDSSLKHPGCHLKVKRVGKWGVGRWELYLTPLSLSHWPTSELWLSQPACSLLYSSWKSLTELEGTMVQKKKKSSLEYRSGEWCGRRGAFPHHLPIQSSTPGEEDTNKSEGSSKVSSTSWWSWRILNLMHWREQASFHITASPLLSQS